VTGPGDPRGPLGSPLGEAPIQVQLLGAFRVAVGGEAVPEDAWHRRKARQLLKCLLSQPNRRLTKDEAVDLFWPDSDPAAAATNLRSTVHAIRRALEQAGAREADGAIGVERDSVFVRGPDTVAVDADLFERAATDALRAGDLAGLQAAARLYAGDYLPEDLYEDWAGHRREQLKRLWTDLEFGLARQYEQRNDLDSAVAELQRLVQADRCDERAAQELMRALLRLGRRSDALRVYRQLEQSLRDELGVEPSDATVELQRQAASGDAAAAAPPAPAFQCSYPFSEPGHFVGREAELARLQRVLERGRTGGQAVLLGAPAGTGKSALVGRVVRLAQEAGYLCLAGGCYEDRGALPLGPFHDALADYVLSIPPARVQAELGTVAVDLVAVVPELRYHLGLAEDPSDEQPDRMRLFGVVLSALRSLAQRSPVLLCLEDLHAADAATLNLLHFVVRQSRRLPLVVIGTFRTDETSERDAPANLLVALTRERLAEQLYLAPLDRDHTASLVSALVGGPASNELSDSLYETTEGNPLFVEQLMLALRDQGQLRNLAGMWQKAETWANGIPTIVREVIGQRLARLSSAALETLAMAAVLGHTFDYGVLLSALEPKDETEVLGDLDEALGAYILRETANNGYAFGHTLLREAMYWSLTAPRRTLLHARAARTLERLAGPRARDQAAELAYHFARAGRSVSTRERALRYSLEAGRQAAALSANREALNHFSLACQLIEDGDLPVGESDRLVALEGRGWAERELGIWSACVATFRQVLARTPDPLRRTHAHSVISYALNHTLDMAAAVAEADVGLAELETVPRSAEVEVARLELQYQKALPLFLQGHYDKLHAMGESMLASAQRLADPRCLLWAHNAIAWACMGRGQVDDALAQYQLALQAAERTGNKVLAAICHENLGIQCYLGRQIDVARSHLERATTLYRDAASDQRALNTLHNLARVWLAAGDPDRAQETVEFALAVAREAGSRWEADCHYVMGTVHLLRDDWERAEASLGQSIRIRKQVGYAEGIALSLAALGTSQQLRGDWQQAAATYKLALAQAEAMDVGPPLLVAHRQLGLLLLLRGDMPAAAQHIRAAEQLGAAMSRTLEYGPTLLVVARLKQEEGDWVAAADYAQRSVEASGSMDQMAEAQIAFVAPALVLGRRAEARKATMEALQLAKRMGSGRLVGLASFAQGLCERAEGRHDEALQWFESAAARVGAPYDRAEIMSEHAATLASQPEGTTRARTLLEEARSTFRTLGAAPAVARCERALSALAADGLGSQPVSFQDLDSR
jgi:DNA-binding SARP family transcriptional activator